MSYPVRPCALLPVAAAVFVARFIPGYSLVNLGVRHEGRWLGRGATLRAHVDNVFDKNHWAAATPRLYAGLPRTYKVSLQVDL